MAERYKIYEKLGAGGNGAVYRAYDGQLKRWVAIKRLLSASEAASNDPNATELRKEADTLAALRNANIVTIFDVATDAEGLFIVMELLEGPDLSDAIAHGPLMLDDFKQLAEQSLEALLVAHQHRVLHRDIKPENIKVERLPGGRLQAKIIDFGLARAGFTARKQTEDQDGSVMGSIYYMAPEQLSREATDARTDLYALGCVFYEALSSRKAFDGKDVMDVIDKHIDHEYTPLAVICPYLPQWLTYWVNRLMARQPDDRPATAQQAIEEFRAWEKLPAQPGVAPWMPMQMYQPAYGYAPQQPQYPTGNVPAHTTGYYPVPQDTNTVQLTPGYDTQPIYATAVPATQSAAVPSRPSPGPRPKGGPRPAPKPITVTPPASLLQAHKTKLIIAAAVVALLAIGFMLFGGKSPAPGKGTAGKPSSPSSSAISLTAGPPREDIYPQDRAFLQPDAMRVLHLNARVGTRGYGKDSSGKFTLISNGGDKFAVVWDDLSKRGDNNLLRSPMLKPEYSPEKVNWTSPDETLKGDRRALWFPGTDGKTTSLSSVTDAKAIDLFPFGTVSGNYRAGFTLAVVFSASPKLLPGRVIRIASRDGQAEVSLRVMQNRAIRASFISGGKTIDCESSGIDGTQPCLAVLTWSGETSEVQLRTREARGTTHRSELVKQALPVQPLSNITIGPNFDAEKNTFIPGNGFEGNIAEVILFSTTLKEDQLALLDKDLRDYYFQAKPGSSNPTKNKDLADWKVGEEKIIFNGKDLGGWRGRTDIWSVQDGALTGKGNPQHPSGATLAYIHWDQGTVKDFQLSCQFKSTPDNNGIMYRANVGRDSPAGLELIGYQADIDLSGNRLRTGTLYEVSGRGTLVGTIGQSGTLKDNADVKKVTLALKDKALGDPNELVKLLKPNDWNEYVIVADGNRLQHRINGTPFIDVIDEGHGALKSGVIGFELALKTKQVVQFKDIKLKRLR